MLAVVNTTQTALTAGSVISVGNTRIKTNNDAVLNGNIQIQKAGTFEVEAIFVFTPTTAGNITVQMQAGGVNVPGATATVTATAGGYITLPVMATVQTRQSTPGANVPITWTINAAGTLQNAVARSSKTSTEVWSQAHPP